MLSFHYPYTIFIINKIIVILVRVITIVLSEILGLNRSILEFRMEKEYLNISYDAEVNGTRGCGCDDGRQQTSVIERQSHKKRGR